MGRTSRTAPLPDVPRATVPDPSTQRIITAIVTSLQAVLKFLKPYAEPEPWRYLLYETTWSDYSVTATFTRAAHRKDAMGRVYLRGFSSRSGGALTTIGVLPLGYRPNRISVFLQYGSIAGTCTVNVYPDGRLECGAAAGAIEVSLDGISFDTEA